MATEALPLPNSFLPEGRAETEFLRGRVRRFPQHFKSPVRLRACNLTPNSEFRTPNSAGQVEF